MVPANEWAAPSALQPADLGKRALVVDDAPEVVAMVAPVLAGLGYHVTVAADGATALDLARDLVPHLVVLDVGLPGIDGLEVCRRLRSTSDAHVVMLTGRAEEVDVLVGLAAGADDYLAKPFSPRELGARVRAVTARGRRAVDAPPPALDLRDQGLAAVLHRALTSPNPAAGGLVVRYQPKVDPWTGLPVAVEALVRFDHPEGHLLAPSAFVSVVENAGLMSLLTTAVLRTSLAQLAQWSGRGLDLGVAVNVSPSDLADPTFADRVSALLHAHGIAAPRLTLEVVEDGLMEDQVACFAALGELRARGVSISIDDYGTGRSSLAYLRDLPADELKLDRSFVDGVAGDDRTAAIVRSTVALAASLGLRVVAEGVERRDDLATVRDAGVHLVQGYVFGAPMEPQDLLTWAQLRPGSPPELVGALTRT